MEKKAKTTKQIFLSQSSERPSNASADYCFVFSPCANPWDDQGFSKLYDLTIYESDKVHRLDRLTRFLFEGESFGYDFLSSLPEKTILLKTVTVKFLSQISDRDDFQRLVEVIGRTRALNLLLRINDSSILKSMHPTSPNLVLVQEKAFRISLLRSSEAFRAFMNGPGNLINNTDFDPPLINLRFQLSRFTNEHELELDFKSSRLFDSRMIVLVGKNGVGKSQAIYNLVNTVLGGDEGAAREQCEFSRIVLFSSLASDYYLKGFDPKDFRGLYYKYVNLIEGNRNIGLIEAIKTILHGGHSDRMKEKRLDLLFSLLKSNIDFKELLLPMNDSSYEDVDGTKLARIKDYFRSTKEVDRAEFLGSIDSTKKIVFWNGKEEVLLSAGQDFFANLAGRVVATVEKGSLLLFDEPETYLHPNLEVDFVNLLQEILSVTSSYAVIATHSVFITREVPRSHVFILMERDKEIHIHNPQIQTFGASLDQISDYIFGDFRKKKPFQERLKSEAKTSISLDHFFKEHKKDLNTNTILLISNMGEEDEVL